MERLLGAGLSNAKAKCSLYLILPRRTNDSIFRNFVTFSPNAKTKGPPDPKKIIGLVGVAEGGVYCREATPSESISRSQHLVKDGSTVKSVFLHAVSCAWLLTELDNHTPEGTHEKVEKKLSSLQ